MARTRLPCLAFVLLLCLSQPAIARSSLPPRPIEQAASGLPSPGHGPLNPDSFVAIQARKLAHPQMLLVNMEALREMGIDVPVEGPTPEFVQRLLDAWAWAIPSKGDNVSKGFTSEVKTFYADRYGGSGVGDNGGSGRAMAAGSFQLKGSGLTPLSRADEAPAGRGWLERLQAYWDNFHHTTGRMPVSEATMEYVWGEELARELPYGANRVVAIIATGLSVPIVPGVTEPSAIVVRQNSIRPAHFIRNWKALETDGKAETARARQLDQELESALPKPADLDTGATLGKRLGAEIDELIDRVGTQFGAEYGLSLYHGSTSPSNIDISGAALDHFPMSALYGFPKVLNADISPSGSTLSLRDEMLYQFVDDLGETLPAAQRRSLPSHAEIARRLNSAFGREVKKTLLWVTGVPDDFLDELASNNAGKDLGVTLLKVARAGNDTPVEGRTGVPTRNLGKYDFYQVARQLADYGNTSDADAALARVLPDEALRAELLSRYQAFSRALLGKAAEQGISESSIATYLREAVNIRARPLPELMRTKGNTARLFMLSTRYRLSGDPQVISDYAWNVLDHTARHEHNLPAFRLVLEEHLDHDTGSAIRRVFNLRTGRNEILVQAPIAEDHLSFFGNRLPLQGLNDDSLRMQSGSSTATATLLNPPGPGDEYATFVTNSPGSEIDLANLRLSISSHEGFFAGGERLSVRIGKPDIGSKCDLILLNLNER